MKVLVELILGHRASIRDKPTPEGYTHDWEVYVKGDQANIATFVDRVIFTLHESFPRPKRVVKEPPFSVKESGYAGFIVTIEILFKTKGDDPRKAEFSYDLFLQTAGPPIVPSRKEKLIFENPSDDFIKKLTKGGATIVENKSGGSAEKSLYAANTTTGGIGSNSVSGHGGGKSKPGASAKVSPKNQFENLFGTPIKRASNNTPVPPPPPTTQSSSSISVTSSSNNTTPTNIPSKNGGFKEGSSSSKETSTKSKDKDKSKSKHDRNSSNAILKDKMSLMSKSPLTPETTTSATTSSSKSSSSSSEKKKKDKDGKKKEKGSSKKMLPPSITSVPKKAKKSDMFTTEGPTPTSSSFKEKSSKSEKKSSSKDKSSKINIKLEVDDANNIKLEKSPNYGGKKSLSSERGRPSSRNEKPILSPISSSSTSSSSSSSASSPSAIQSEEDSESEVVGRGGNVNKKSPNTASSTSTSRKRLKKSRSRSPNSGGSLSSPAPSSASSSSSISAASAAEVPTTSSNNKKRKGSSSSSRSPPSKKIILDKPVPVSSSNNKGEYREGKKSKKKSSEKSSKSSKVGSSVEDVSSAKSPTLSLEITGSSTKNSKKHNNNNNNNNVVVAAPAENSDSVKKSKSSSSKNKSGGTPTDQRNSASSTSNRGNKNSKNHDRDREHLIPKQEPQEESAEEEIDSEILHSSDSSESYNSGERANGSVSNNQYNNMGSSPGGGILGGNSGFSHAGVAGSITAEMKLLKELHSRISLLIHDDPMKLQEIVDIVESSGKDCWSVETGLTFDFDLCKLSSSTIKRLKQAVL